MLIRIGYDMSFQVPAAVTMVTLLHVHPTRVHDLRAPEELHVEPGIALEDYTDSFGNHCCRLLAPYGTLRLRSETTIEADGNPEELIPATAVQHPVDQLPPETLQFLLPSRYCEVDTLSPIAVELFGHIPPGGQRVIAILNWVHWKVQFGYHFARSTKTALDVYTERTGVCRDFQHLAVTFCRCLNIPARYATGYLGDIQVPPTPPMDFSAWFEVYLEGRWWSADARFNTARVGRTLMATGRDAADVAITTSFGLAKLVTFSVTAEEVSE